MQNTRINPPKLKTKKSKLYPIYSNVSIVRATIRLILTCAPFGNTVSTKNGI